MNVRYLKIDVRSIPKGFSMVEVLVTMAIVAVGLMGLIALMMKGLQANSGSSMRTIANAQAYDMADRMRSNIAGVASGEYGSVLPPGSTSTCPITGQVAPPSGPMGTCADGTASLSKSDVATRDECIWHKANSSFLPSGAGAVCKNGANNWYTVSISWDDKKSGSTDTTFKLEFEP